MMNYEERRESLKSEEWVIFFDDVNKIIEVSNKKKYMKDIAKSSQLAYFKHTHKYQIQYGIPQSEDDPPKFNEQMKYERPEWVRWEAKDKTGETWGYSHRPEKRMGQGWFKIDPDRYPNEETKSIMYGHSKTWCDEWFSTLIEIK